MICRRGFPRSARPERAASCNRRLKHLRELDTPQNRLILWAVLTVMAGGLRLVHGAGAAPAQRGRKLHLGIVSVSIEYLQNVLVPDGMGAGMHVDYLLLTSRGVVVVTDSNT